MAKTIKNFDQLIGLLNRGRFAEKCDEELERAMTALKELPKEKGKAKITVEITIASDSGRLDVTPVVKSKLPETGTFSATPFWEAGGALSVEHPNQHDMFAGPRKVAPSIPAAPEGEPEGKFADVDG